MNKLGKRNYDLISLSMKTLGFKDYTDGLMFEERMYVHEIHEITQFLKWLKNIDRPFGYLNYEIRFAEFRSGERPPKSWFEVHVHFPEEKDKCCTSEHSHIKRISGDHTDKLQIAARLCSNLDDPDYIKVIEVNGTYIKNYSIPGMKKFIKKNQDAINKTRKEVRELYPSEGY